MREIILQQLLPGRRSILLDSARLFRYETHLGRNACEPPIRFDLLSLSDHPITRDHQITRF